MKILIEISYLVAACLFILGIKRLGSPKTAVKGNQMAGAGMLVAIIATLFDQQIIGWGTIFLGMVIGSVIGVVIAKRVSMTAMPQMVALLNGLGGGASAFVGTGEYLKAASILNHIDTLMLLIMQLTVFVGAVTLTGSLIAYAKLQGLIKGTPVRLPNHQLWNKGLLAAFVLLTLVLCMWSSQVGLFWMAFVIAHVLGVFFVLPIGGADMPVVISILNSLSGVAASIAGFIIGNDVLIISGALVGASGIILTQIMCKAMNRPLKNVLFGSFGATSSAVHEKLSLQSSEKGTRSVTPEEAAMMLGYARKVIIVPGYGMAVAQAQHAVKELEDVLEARQIEVKYAIHPVAGRMPGHMNVLLAEANVSYDNIKDMDQINPEFETADAAVVIGANDVVNPAAKDNPNSPIYGMPILEVHKAKAVIVIKRSMNPGFAGIENELFHLPQTAMLFGSAKEITSQLTGEIKNLP